MVIRESRAARIQPFNQYRKRFNLKPYCSFDEFTGRRGIFGILSSTQTSKTSNIFSYSTDDPEMAQGLEELYGDIDALEFYPGVLLEKTRSNAIFGESMVEMGAPFSLKGLMGNPICSPEYWKPSTFGGDTGFNIVKTATIKKLVCLNSRWCPYVNFHIPRNEEEAKPRKPSTEL